MIDVGGNDGAAAGDLRAHEFGRHERRQRRAEALPVGEPRFCFFALALASDILAVRHIDHLLGDNAGAGKLKLGDRGAGNAPHGLALAGERPREMARGHGPVVLRPDHPPRIDLNAAARFDPGGPQREQSALHVD